MRNSDSLMAFCGIKRLAEGLRPQVAKTVSEKLKADPTASILVFDRETGCQVDLDLCATTEDEVGDPPLSPGPGRPKLGVVGREVTLLPRHWEWLSSQPGGASVALRKLVENARRDHAVQDNIKQRQEAAYKFMTAIAGNLPGYEEALRCLFANDRDGVLSQTIGWPADVRDFAIELAFPSPIQENAPLA